MMLPSHRDFLILGLRAVGIAVLVGTLGSPSFAQQPQLQDDGQKPLVVLLVHPDSPRHIIHQLRLELLGLGLDVREQAAGAQVATPSRLETATAKTNAMAAVHIAPLGRAIQVWISDRLTGKILYRKLADTRQDAMALAAVELLRASLLELHLTGGSEQPVPEPVEQMIELKPAKPETAAPAPAPASVSRFALGAGTGVRFAGRDFPLLWTTTLRLSLRAAPGWNIGAQVELMPVGAELQDEEGTSSSEAALYGVNVTRAWSWEGLEVRAGLGIAVARVVTTGVPKEGYTGKSDAVWSAVPSAEAAAVWPLSENWQFGGIATAGWVLNQPMIEFDERTVGRWGRVLLGLSFVLEVRLPQ